MLTRDQLRREIIDVLSDLNEWPWDDLELDEDGLNDIEELKRLEIEEHLYYQPPETLQLTYPCIVYSLKTIDPKHADNKPYLLKCRYQLTVIDPDPDSEIRNKVAMLPKCKMDRIFTYGNLYHYVFTIYD